MTSLLLTEWGPPALVLTAAAALGAFFLRARRGTRTVYDAAPSNAREAVQDIEARYREAMAALKDHALAVSATPADAWNRTNERLENRAGALLSELRSAQHEAAKTDARQVQLSAAPMGFFARHPTARGALLGGVTVAFVGGVILSLVHWESPSAPQDRAETMPERGTKQEDPRGAALLQRLRADPNDSEALSEWIMLLMRRQDFAQAAPLSARLTLLDPFNVKGRVARAVFRVFESDSPDVSELRKLATRYQEANDANLFAGLILADGDEPKAAAAYLREYLEAAPPGEPPPMLSGLIARMEAGPEAK